MTIRSDWCWDLIDVFAFIKGLAARVKHESGELVLGSRSFLFDFFWFYSWRKIEWFDSISSGKDSWKRIIVCDSLPGRGSTGKVDFAVVLGADEG